MKKFLSVILAIGFVFSLAACNAKPANKPADTTKPAASTPKFTPKAVAAFPDILDNLGNKDNFFTDISVLKVNSSKTYAAAVKPLVDKALADNKIDAAKAKQYNYYKNLKGDKTHKVYVVTYGDDKVPTGLYEINMTVDMKDVPTFKEFKKVDGAIDDNFKKYFPDQVK